MPPGLAYAAVLDPAGWNAAEGPAVPGAGCWNTGAEGPGAAAGCWKTVGVGDGAAGWNVAEGPTPTGDGWGDGTVWYVGAPCTG